ncbi:MAG: GlsB/YeaQ/YmgE family stress response membrane protein [Alistipes sp.]|nr:GlsB/YeaQ/YmgE family stress response membrane protein [Alistipes sp.]
MFFLWYLLIGLVAGWLANLMVKGRGAGLWINLIVGIIGGVLGGWLFSLAGLFAVGTFGSLVTALVGAIVLLWIVSALSRHNNVRENAQS